MSFPYPTPLWIRPVDKHKTFVSYYHQDDEAYRMDFEQASRNLLINKSVQPGHIDPDISAEYVKRLILENYITDASVVIVLVGPNTRKRKHVDWEIAAGLSRKVGGYSGLIEILLPSIRLGRTEITCSMICRLRLAANARTEYAPICTWAFAMQSPETSGRS